MINCPMCRAKLPDDTRKCGKCQTELDLLADYVSHLRAGLGQAEALTRAGELGEAVWAYLAVLEIDPDNSTARRQVGQVVTAVRQFDSTAPGRRWLSDIHRERWWQRWLGTGGGGDDEESGWAGLLSWAAGGLLVFALLWFTYSWGYQAGRAAQAAERPAPGPTTFVPMMTVEEQEKKEADEKARLEKEKKEKERKEREKKEREKKEKERPEKPLGRP